MKKRKILVAFMMLLVTAVTLTTASYAWFTANTTAVVQSLDVNVTAQNGIQISMDATNWKGSLTVDDIKGEAYSGHSNQVPTELIPVSTGGTLDANGLLQMYKGGIEVQAGTGDNLITTVKTTEAVAAAGALAATEGDFIAFDLFIQVNQEEDIYLSLNSNVLNQDNNKDGEINAADDTGLKNTARVAFIVEGTSPVGTANSTVVGMKDASATPVIWEPNADYHTAGGIAAASSIYSLDVVENPVVESYSGVNSAISIDDAVLLNSTSATYFKTVTPTIQTTSTTATKSELFTLPAGISKVRIYAWIEGQDVDCENNASGSGITFDIRLEKAQ